MLRLTIELMYISNNIFNMNKLKWLNSALSDHVNYQNFFLTCSNFYTHNQMDNNNIGILKLTKWLVAKMQIS